MLPVKLHKDVTARPRSRSSERERLSVMKIAGNGLGVSCLSVCLAISLQSLGCVYALQVPAPPAREHFRIVAKTPEVYVLRVKASRTVEYPVPPDGHLTIAIPAYGPGCRVYLFGVMKVSNGYDQLKDWTAEISVGGSNVRTLSIRDLIRLPADSEGNRLIKIRG